MKLKLVIVTELFFLSCCQNRLPAFLVSVIGAFVADGWVVDCCAGAALGLARMSQMEVITSHNEGDFSASCMRHPRRSGVCREELLEMAVKQTGMAEPEQYWGWGDQKGNSKK